MNSPGPSRTLEPTAAPAFDLRAFRRALSCFTTGVAVVTATDAESRPLGLTISSFNSVSLEPPLVLFSLARSAHSLEAMRRAQGYAVNVLAAHQRDLSDRFARALHDKWSAVAHASGHGGSRLLDGALAHFECAPYAEHDGGDHVIFVARVVRFAEAAGEPLVFFRGAYRQLADGGLKPSWPLPIHY